MRLGELVELVRASAPGDWDKITPVRLERVVAHGPEAPEIEIQGHEYLAHYVDELDVALAWGADHRSGEAWEGAWADWAKFPDSRVYGFYGELLWRGSPVYRQLMVSVDGGRAYLPTPNPVLAGDAPTAAIERWTVKQTEVWLPRLLDGLQRAGGGANFDEYFDRAKLEVVDDD